MGWREREREGVLGWGGEIGENGWFLIEYGFRSFSPRVNCNTSESPLLYSLNLTREKIIVGHSVIHAL